MCPQKSLHNWSPVLRAGIVCPIFARRREDAIRRPHCPTGMAAIADALGVPLQLVPGLSRAIAADAGTGKGHRQYRAEPQRAAVMDFTAAYAEIEATYLVPPGSTMQAIDEVDRPGNRISVSQGSAYGLWLENNIKQAELKPIEGGDAAFAQFVTDTMEALASLRPRLVTDAAKLPGSRILAGQFAYVQQAIGINKGNEAAYNWLKAFVEASKANGLVARFIEKFGVQGKLSVAPLA